MSNKICYNCIPNREICWICIGLVGSMIYKEAKICTNCSLNHIYQPSKCIICSSPCDENTHVPSVCYCCEQTNNRCIICRKI